MAAKRPDVCAGHQGIYMYHVTNVLGTDEEPEWGEVKVNAANDSYFDEDLLGLPVACFSTTLFDGLFPTRSPYPRQYDGKIPKEGTEFWRVSVPFNPSEFEIIDMQKPASTASQTGLRQIHLLCLKKNNEKDKLLAEILWERRLSNQARGQYFPGNAANTYNSSSLQEQKFFVNVTFINPVTVGDNARWTRVCRDIKAQEKWGEKQLKSSWEELKKFTEQVIDDNQKSYQINFLMQKGKDALQQQWKALFPQEENQEELLCAATETMHVDSSVKNND